MPVKAQLALSSMLNAVEPSGLGTVIPASRAPTGEQRAWLDRRRAAIDDWLAPCSEEEVLREIGLLFASMAFRPDQSEVEARLRLAAYTQAFATTPETRGPPGWALSRACEDYRLGRVGDGVFIPRPGELRLLAVSHTRPWSRESANIGRVLDSRIECEPDADDAATRAAAIRRWNEEIKPGVMAAARADDARRLGKPQLAEALDGAASLDATPELAVEWLESIRGKFGAIELSPSAIATVKRQRYAA